MEMEDQIEKPDAKYSGSYRIASLPDLRVQMLTNIERIWTLEAALNEGSHTVTITDVWHQMAFRHPCGDVQSGSGMETIK